MRLLSRRLVSYGPQVAGGQPIPTGSNGEPYITDTEAVSALGRHRWYGDAVIRILARLASGEVVQLTTAEQDSEAQKWLRRRLRKWKRTPYPQREAGYAIVWELCQGDQGCDGSGKLPNGERCDLCERYPSDEEAQRA